MQLTWYSRNGVQLLLCIHGGSKGRAWLRRACDKHLFLVCELPAIVGIFFD